MVYNILMLRHVNVKQMIYHILLLRLLNVKQKVYHILSLRLLNIKQMVYFIFFHTQLPWGDRLCLGQGQEQGGRLFGQVKFSDELPF